MGYKKRIFLFTRNASGLSLMRKHFNGTNIPVTGCCSEGVLLESLKQAHGCVILSADEHSNEAILKLVAIIRKAGFPHAVLVADMAPSVKRAREILRLPVCDYFQWRTSPRQLTEMIQTAIRWSETEGARSVWRWTLRKQWETMDEGHREVLRLLFSGKTNREIASEMDLSVRAIEARRARLLKTFQVNSFAELIRAATEILDGATLLP